MLARDVRSYLRVHGRADESEEHELRSVCSGLARLVGRLLEGHEQWNRYQWVDSVLLSLAAVVSDEEVSVVGGMIWGAKGSGQQWVEPFFASVRASEDENLLGYHIICGDAATGIGKMPYAMYVTATKRSDPMAQETRGLGRRGMGIPAGTRRRSFAVSY